MRLSARSRIFSGWIRSDLSMKSEPSSDPSPLVSQTMLARPPAASTRRITPAQQSVSSSGCGATTRSEVPESMGGMPAGGVGMSVLVAAQAADRPKAAARRKKRAQPRLGTMVMAARSVLFHGAGSGLLPGPALLWAKSVVFAQSSATCGGGAPPCACLTAACLHGSGSTWSGMDAQCTGLISSPHASDRRRFQGILRPVVLRIAASQVLADLGVRAAPEARQIARDLHGPLRRREQLE